MNVTRPPRPGGTVSYGQPDLWLAYYEDFSGLVIFASEIEALRHAVDHTMKVAKIRAGEDLRDQALRGK